MSPPKGLQLRGRGGLGAGLRDHLPPGLGPGAPAGDAARRRRGQAPDRASARAKLAAVGDALERALKFDELGRQARAGGRGAKRELEARQLAEILRIEDARPRGSEQEASSDFLRRRTLIRLCGAGVLMGLGEDVATTMPLIDETAQARGPGAGARRLVSTIAESLPACLAMFELFWASRSAARGLDGVTARGRTSPWCSTSCSAEAGSIPRSHARARAAEPVRFVVERRPRRAARCSSRCSGGGALSGLRFKLDPTFLVGPGADRGAGRDGGRRLGRLQGPVRGARSSTSPPIRCSTSAWSRRSPTPGSRTRS